MSRIVVLAAALLQAAGGVSARVQLEPQSVTVLRGDEARFNCSVEASWTVMSWLLNGRVVMTISAVHGVLDNSDSFTVLNHTTSQTSRWELELRNVTRSYAGEVTCDLQNIEKQTAALFVQEVGNVRIVGGDIKAGWEELVVFKCQAVDWFPKPNVTWTVSSKAVDQEDYNTTSVATAGGLFNATSTLHVLATESTWVQCQASVSALPSSQVSRVFLTVDPEGKQQTLLIAVVASVSAFVLLLLLIIAIVCCYRRRAKSRHPDDTRGKDWRSETPVQEAGQGRVNLGYTWEGNTGIARSELHTGRSQTNAISTRQVPDVVSMSEHSPSAHENAYTSFREDGAKTVRHATTV